MSAVSLSNAVDFRQSAKREERYMWLIRKYEREDLTRFAQMLAEVTMSLELGFHDCLGQMFMALELGDHWKGQFFTPYEVYLMASLTVSDVATSVQERGYFIVNEPAVGAGVMVIALAELVLDKGLNYQRCMHVTAQDLDETAVHMAYIQCTLLHIPAAVVHGNSLWPKGGDEVWYTAAHVLDGWNAKLAAGKAPAQDLSLPVMASQATAETTPTVAAAPASEPQACRRGAKKDSGEADSQLSLFD